MMDISIIRHLKSISSIFIDKNDEFIIHCPFCDDATRPAAYRHGHCYISKSKFLFHCFRCGSSGTLIKLLSYTQFDNKEILEYLKKTNKYEFIKNYQIKPNKRVKKDFIHEIIDLNIKFSKERPNEFKRFKDYIENRIGKVDYIKFLITPGFLYNKLTCNFYNYNGQLVIQRFIDDSKFRYYTKNNSETYFFQNKNFEKFKNIVLAEGPFDIICLYLYNSIFKDCIFISLNGKRYISVIEKLITEELLIGDYTINVVFDADVNDYIRYIQILSKMIKHYNANIRLNSFKPYCGKDAGDFPAIQLIF